MPRHDPDDSATWLALAMIDHRSAHALLALSPPVVETACFHIQQAIEKMLKAVIVERRLRLPFTHDIATLLSVVGHDDTLYKLAFSLSMTSDYAVALRYPGARTPEMTEVFESLHAMEQLLEWTRAQLETNA